jgi:hypothetical protein
MPVLRVKVVGYLLAACVACAALQAAAAALALLVGLAVVIGVCTRPRETFGLLLVLVIVSVIRTNPGILAATVAMVAFASVVASRTNRSR